MNARAVPLEQHRVEFALERPYLQADGGLAQEQLLRGIGHLAALGHRAESTQLLELIAFIIEAW